MRLTAIVVAASAATILTACHQQPAAPKTAEAALPAPTELAAPGEEIAWREGDVQDALAEAKESGKPVLLYWGAKWCPPCNQLKSTLFRDRAFIAQTRGFIPVHLDGDTTGAQRWGERFGISGYPTVIVLRADGSEIVRLSGATPRLAEVLRVAAGRTTSIDDVFAKADKDAKSLSADDWRLLGAFDWQNDPKHFGDHGRAAALLNRLAGAAPEPALQHRFALLALVMGAKRTPDGKFALTTAQQTEVTQVLPAILASPAEVIANRQQLSDPAAQLIAALPDAAQRQTLGASLIKALEPVTNDTSLPLPDRMYTVKADIVLDKADHGNVSPAVLARVRDRTKWADTNAREAMVRQSVISDAADLLHQAGDDTNANALLQAELKRSAQPYYYMLDLSGIAEDAGDGPTAIAWARKAYETSEGEATRVQWAIEYSKTVLRQAPGDSAQVAASAQAVIDALGSNTGSYYQRTRLRVAAWGGLLRNWSAAHHGGAVLSKIDKQMVGVCAKQGEAAATCRKWAKPV